MDQKCPYCHGAGGCEAFINRGPDISTHSQQWVECSTCSGFGTVNEKRAKLVEQGRVWRNERVARRETLLELSKRIGMGPAEISAIEHGRGQQFQFDAFRKLIGQ